MGNFGNLGKINDFIFGKNLILSKNYKKEEKEIFT